jgi:hypothetical protein
MMALARQLMRDSLRKTCIAGCFVAAACGGQIPESEPVVFDGPIDLQRGASSILIHRQLPVGTRMRVQGQFRNHRRTVAKDTGYVLGQDVENLQMAYDIIKTVLDVDLYGSPKRVRYEVVGVKSSRADIPPFEALGEHRAVHLQDPAADEVSFSAGQVFDIEWGEGGKVSMVAGKLSASERAVLTDPFGPAYELWLEQELAYMFGPKQRQRVGDEWEIDLKRAQALLVSVSNLKPPIKISGGAKFAQVEKIGGIQVQKIEGWARAEGDLRTKVTKKIHASNSRIELRYAGVFPVDLNLPPLEHDWNFKCDDNLIVEVNDTLGDIHTDQSIEHQTRIMELRR